MIRLTIVLPVLLFILGPGGDETVPASSSESSLISCEDSFGQTSEQLKKRWEQLTPEQRRLIGGFLTSRLGLSSTGQIQLIGVYVDPDDVNSDTDRRPLFHFRQVDLFGSRLFWTVVVDPNAETAQVLYHINRRKRLKDPVPLRTRRTVEDGPRLPELQSPE